MKRNKTMLLFLIRLLFMFPMVGLYGCDTAWAQEGYMTYYTTKSCQTEGTSGVFTANGERYDESKYTIALPNRGFGAYYLVCGPLGCKEARHNDYGPGKRPRGRGVIVDGTPALFKWVCGDLKKGKCLVNVMPIE